MTLPECNRLLEMSRKLDPMVATEEDKIRDPEQRSNLQTAKEETAERKKKWEASKENGPTNLDT